MKILEEERNGRLSGTLPRTVIGSLLPSSAGLLPLSTVGTKLPVLGEVRLSLEDDDDDVSVCVIECCGTGFSDGTVLEEE